MPGMIARFLAGLAFFLSAAALRTDPAASVDYDHPSWLWTCESIYLDVGSNIGVQIRKLFEPAKYPAAKIKKTFERVYGAEETRPSKVCALGIEPNPDQQERLRELEAAYNARGFRTHFYPYAAWKEEDTMHFEVNRHSVHENWGAHIEGMKKKPETVAVRAIDLANFIMSLPKGRVKLMKMDIEGAEYETLAHAIPLDILCDKNVGEAYMEAHIFGAIDTWKDLRNYNAVHKRIMEHTCRRGKPTEMLEVDDETYLHDVDRDFAR